MPTPTSEESAASRAERRREQQRRRKAERRERARRPAAAARRELPHVALLVPAAAGLLLAGYLAATSWAGTGPAACAPGSDCDLVQESRYAWLLGIPIAAYGAAVYAGLVLVAAAVASRRLHGLLALGLSGVGLAVSLYLTAVSVFELGATCLWCLTSLALVATCFGVAVVRRPDPASGDRAFLAGSAAAAAVVVAGLHLHYQGVFSPTAGPEDPRLRALAVHLSESGARFYGASWCPHCNQQKELFGASADRLPYVECSPGGRGTPQAPACRDAGIRAYPTWTLDGERHRGLLSPVELARRTDFAWTEAGSGSAQGR